MTLPQCVTRAASSPGILDESPCGVLVDAGCQTGGGEAGAQRQLQANASDWHAGGLSPGTGGAEEADRQIRLLQVPRADNARVRPRILLLASGQTIERQSSRYSSLTPRGDEFGATVLVPESTRNARFACDAERPMEAFRKAVHGPPARKERLPRMGSPHCHRSGVA